MNLSQYGAVSRRIVLGVLLAALVVGGALRSSGEDPPPPPAIEGSIRNDGSTPPVGKKLQFPTYVDLPTVYTVEGASFDFEISDEGNVLPKSLSSSFSGTTGESEEPKLFTVSAHTKGAKTQSGAPLGDYRMEPYFRADKKLACPRPACSGPLDVQLYAKFGNVRSTVSLPDGTPLPLVTVRADPSTVPAGASEVFLPKQKLTGVEGTVDFTAAALGPTRMDNADCYPAPPHTISCSTVPFESSNNWGLRLLGDGGLNNRDTLYYSNKPGEFDWVISLPGARPPAMPERKETVTVKSSQASLVFFTLSLPEWQKILLQQPWPDPDGRPEDADDGLEGWAEEPPEAAPCAPHPVSLLSGNVFLDQTDVSMPGLRHPLVFKRSYNSQSTSDGILGRGWTHNFEKRIEVKTERAIGVWVGGVPRLYTDSVGSGTLGRYGKAASSDSFITRSSEGFLRSFRTGGHEVFNPDGRLIRRVDRTGRTTTLTYQGNVLTEVRSPEGRRLSFEYSGRLRRIVGPEGVVADFDYETLDGSHLLTGVRYPDGTGYSFTYDEQYRLKDVSDLQGMVLDRHGYEGEGNRAAWSELNAGRERRSYLYEDGQTIVTDERGLVSTFKWEQKISGKFITEISGCGYCGPASGRRTFKRDDEGRITKYTDADNHASSYTWVGANLTQARDGAGRTTTYGEHDSFGRPGSLTRTGFGTTQIAYGLEGATRLTQPGGQPTEITYENQRVKTVRTGSGLTHHYDINDLGDLKSITDSRGKVTRFTHDGLGRPITVERPDGEISRLVYDVGGRPSSIERPDGKQIRLTWDGSGRLAAITDPAGKVTRLSYDAYGRLEAVIDPLGAVTRLAYDVMSNAVSLTDALNHTTHYEYDGVGRVSKMTDAMNRTEQYEYFSSGRLRVRRDRKGVATTYAYDGAGRLTGKTYSDSTPPLAVDYDDENRRVTLSNGTDTVEMAFDNSGRLVSETSSRNANTVSYTYNDDHQKESLRLDGDLIASYGYQQGYLDKIAFSGKELGFDYDSLGRREKLVYPNGLETRYSFVPAVGWLEKIKTLSGGTLLWEWSYRHDDVGNRTSKRSPEGLETYTYDAGDRLTRVQRSEGWTGRTSFDYDLVGNRLREQADSFSLAHRHDATNRLLETSPAGRIRVSGNTNEPAAVTVQGHTARAVAGHGFEAEIPVATGDNTLVVEAEDASGNTRSSTYSLPVTVGDVTYTHDANGNLARKTDSSGTWTYEWGVENELLRFVRDGAEVARFAYDPLGRRVEKVAGAVTTRYSYDGMDIVRESRTDGVSTTTYTYVHGPAIDEPLARLDSSGTIAYYHADGLASVVRVSDAVGAVAHAYSYSAWGNIETGSLRAAFAFNGREWDPETGLYFYRARYYDPRLGRFISEDPIGIAGGSNYYAYVRNSPALWRDPWGLRAYLDRYRSVDQAALTALADAYKKSDFTQREYAGTIYRNADGTYSYTEPNPGPFRGNTSDSGIVDWWRNHPDKPPVGDYHTHWDHPKGTDNEKFSEPDQGNAGVLCFGWGLCVPHYLMTPSLTIKRLDPATGKIREWDLLACSWK